MISNHVNVLIAESIEKAPHYTPDWKAVKLTSAIIVPKGTEEGNPTVDLQITDADGNKYVVMTTGAIIESLSGACVGVRKRGMT